MKLFLSACLFALFISANLVNAASYNNNYNYGHNGYRYGYYNPHYTYSYPSYYTYQQQYYTPSYQPSYQYYTPPSYCQPSAPAENTTDKVIKELMLRKLMEEQGLSSNGGPMPKTVDGPANPKTLPEAIRQQPASTSLSAEEVAQLRELIKILKEKAAQPEKQPEKKE